MAEQNKGSKLEDMLFDLGSLHNIYRGIEKSKSPTELSNLYLQLAGTLANDDKERERELLENTNFNTLEDMYLANLRYGPETAVRFATQGIAKKSAKLEPLYKENKEKISKKVIASMKDTLKSASNKAEAALVISQYLEGLLEDIPELDQVTADKYARNQLEAITGIHGLYDVRGSIEGYKGLHEQNTLVKRILASEYLKDIKDKKGNVTGYRLNEEKIAKEMENIGYGAVVYTNTKAIEQAKQKQKEAEAKK